MRDLKRIGYILLAAATLLILMFESGLAASDRVYNDEENLDASTIFVAQQGVYDYPYEIYSVNQNDKVFLGDHIDISKVAQGYSALAWFSGGWPTETKTAYIIELPESKYKWYNIYLDPAVFKGHTGKWFKWNGYVESSANQIAFEIVAQKRPAGMEVEQVINTTIIEKQEEKAVTKLEEKYVADYLVVHGQSFKIHAKQAPFKAWIFGTKDSIYDKATDEQEIAINKSEVMDLQSGKYKILLQYRGVNNQFDVSYNPNKEELGRVVADAWGKSELVEIDGIQPMMVYDRLTALLDKSDDKYETVSLEVQDPALQIIEMEEVEVRSAKDYYKDNPSGITGTLAALRGNVSVFRIQGYTNVNQNTGLKFYLDEDQQAKPQAYPAHADGSSPGNMRTFKVDIPVYWDGIKEGPHTISGYTDVGGSVYSDFNINIAPEHSYIPSEVVKWVGGENPWKPNLTTMTVVVTQVVTQKVYVNVTPPDEQVKAQQAIVQNEINAKNWQAVYTIAGLVIAGVILFLVGKWLYKVYRKAKEERDYERAMRKHEEDMLEHAEALSHEWGIADKDNMEWM